LRIHLKIEIFPLLAMPAVRVVFYCDEGGPAPALVVLERMLERGDIRTFRKCRARIERLAEFGPSLRRPIADYLRGGIYELRVRSGRIHYRILYFFHGSDTAVVSHLITKEGGVPDAEIERASRHRRNFEADPESHTWFD
jgi:phage-related protein